MSFLTINGWEIPVANPSGRFTLFRPQRNVEGPWGQQRVRGSRLLRSWQFETPLLPKEQADAVEGLIAGWGNYHSFESDLFGSHGGRPLTITGTAGTASGKIGNCMALASTQTWGYGYGSYLYGKAWTVLVYRDPNTGTWAHYGVRDDGVKVVDGVRNDGASTTFISWVNGQLTLTGAAGYKFDELVVVPYRMTPAQMIAHHTYMQASNAFSSLRKLKAAGDFLMGANSEIEVRGFVESANQDGGYDTALAAWEPAMRRVSFELVETVGV